MKRSKVVILISALSLFFYINTAHAAQSGIGEGSTELGINGSFSIQSVEDSDSDTKMFLGVFSLGRFITDDVQIGGSFLDLYMWQEDFSVNIIGLDAFAKYFFYEKGQTIIPYGGLQFGLNVFSIDSGSGSDSIDDTASSFSYGLMGGVKAFLDENVSTNFEMNYRRYQYDLDDDGEGNLAVNNISFLFGISYYFQTTSPVSD